MNSAQFFLKKLFPFLKPSDLKRGVTLTELIIAIALMALLFIAFIPQMQGYRKKETLRSAVKEVTDSIKLVQTKALSGDQSGYETSSEKIKYYFLRNESSNTYSLNLKLTDESFVNGVSSYSLSGNCSIDWQSPSLLEAIAFEVPTGKIVFWKETAGGLEEILGFDSATLEITRADIGSLKVIVEKSGRIYLE